MVGPAREVLASPSARDAQDILASEPAKILQIALGGASRAAALMERAADSVAKDGIGCERPLRSSREGRAENCERESVGFLALHDRAGCGVRIRKARQRVVP